MKANPLFDSFWRDGDMEAYDPLKKLLALFLRANEGITMSGIYEVSTARMSRETGIPERLVQHYLGLEELSLDDYRRELLAVIGSWHATHKPGIKNVSYDATRSIAFVHKRLKYRLGGRPDLICRSIIGDWKRTALAVPELWDKFVEENRLFIECNEPLASLFLGADSKQATIPAQATKSVVTKPKRVDDEVMELDCDRMIERYSAELDAEDRGYVLSALEYLLKTKSGKLKNPASRYRMLKRLDKAPTLQVARACYLFMEECRAPGRLLGFDYLIGILNKSALSWYIEYKAAADKQKFRLGE